MDLKYLVLFGIFACSFNVNGLVEFTNVKCDSYDKPFADFAYCHLKAVNRTYKYIALRAHLFKVPITNISLRLALRKKANGYKPFLYNSTFDACKFMENQNHGNKLLKYAYSFIRKYSNLNHTCPYKEDVIVDKLDSNFVNNQFTKILPMPEGEYGIYTSWFAYNKLIADVNVFLKISH